MRYPKPYSRPRLALIFASLLWLLLASCSGSFEADETEPSLPDGTYSMNSASCLSTALPLDYSNQDWALYGIVQQLDFDETSLQVQISNDVIQVLVSDDDCSLSITGRIAANSGQLLALTNTRSHQWEPQGCSFSRVMDSTTYLIDQNNHQNLLIDSTDASTLGSIKVEKIATGYLLTYPTQNYDLNGWCNHEDSIQRELTPL